MTRHYGRIVIVLGLLSFMTITSFQNCSRASFESKSSASTNSQTECIEGNQTCVTPSFKLETSVQNGANILIPTGSDTCAQLSDAQIQSGENRHIIIKAKALESSVNSFLCSREYTDTGFNPPLVTKDNESYSCLSESKTSTDMISAALDFKSTHAGSGTLSAPELFLEFKDLANGQYKLKLVGKSVALSTTLTSEPSEVSFEIKDCTAVGSSECNNNPLGSHLCEIDPPLGSEAMSIMKCVKSTDECCKANPYGIGGIINYDGSSLTCPISTGSNECSKNLLKPHLCLIDPPFGSEAMSIMKCVISSNECCTTNPYGISGIVTYDGTSLTCPAKTK